jgi:hypothetical protein
MFELQNFSSQTVSSENLAEHETQVLIRQVNKNYLSSTYINPSYELGLCKRNLVTRDTRRHVRCGTQYHTKFISYCLEACSGKHQHV